MATEVKIPAMGESISSGILAAWHVKDGDYVEKDQVLYELETDKITSEASAEVAGVITLKVAVEDEVDIGQVVAYVQSLSDPSKFNNLAEYGEGLYMEHCIVCHGADGQGIILGASDLSDDYWQHGGSMMNIRLAISRGVEGQCPPHAELLNETELKLLTAYVMNLKQP